jgi:hypothetical protein
VDWLIHVADEVNQPSQRNGFSFRVAVFFFAMRSFSASAVSPLPVIAFLSGGVEESV